MRARRGENPTDRRTTSRRWRCAVAAPVLGLLAVACQPAVPLLSPANIVGNDVTDCPQFQATNDPGCGPQPGFWAAIQGPYEAHSNGDPYATKCTTATGSGAATCNVPANPNGAANPEYRASGYTYAIDVDAADVGTPISLEGWDVGQFARTLTSSNVTAPVAGDTRDCKRGVAPFNTALYYSSPPSTLNWSNGFGTGQCQTGDSGTKVLNFDVQLFDNDGSDAKVLKTTPRPDCHYRLLTTDPAYDATKNAWTTLCTFTPTQRGIYPFEVRNSGLDGVPDAIRMTGWNAFSLRLSGATASRLRPYGDVSLWMNTPGATHRMYLAEVPPGKQGKKLIVDLYDPGDGAGAPEFAVQLRGPSSGAPGTVPSAGTVVPAPGVASSCAYNSVKAATRGPATPDVAPSCRVITKVAGSGSAIYNDGWLRIEVQLDPAYTCGTTPGTDCWWTLEHQFGAFTFPTDRLVYTVSFA